MHNININKTAKIIMLIVIVILLSIVFSLMNIGNEKIHKNISVQQINIEQKTCDEASSILKNIYNEKRERQIQLKNEDFESTVSYEQLEVDAKIDEAVEKAYAIGRTGNIITNNYTILSTFFIKRNIDLETIINEKELDNIINDTESKLPNVKTDNTYYIEGNNLIIKKGKKGVQIQKEELKQKIKEQINNYNSRENIIEIPVIEVEPEKINIEKIIEEIKKEPKNAYISDNPKKIHAEEKGIELGISLEEAKRILEEDKEEYIIPLTIIEPSITVASLGTDAFTDKLATFTTNYDASNINRNNNLQLAAEKVNETIVNPGEEFSYNKTVGERTIATGFKEAKAYAGGDVVLDVGGGICQLSSTLYNTALLANLEITERHNHNFETSYVDPGRDATVSWGSLDFKFKNNRNYPIKIKASAENGVVTVDIYGIKQEDDKTVIIESKVTSVIERKTEYKQDNKLEKGQEVIERYGEDGSTSETYKTVLQNGIVISKDIISRDTYSPLSKIIRTNK